MFDADLIAQSTALLARCREAKLRIATAESCTGGLIGGALTEIAGSSDVFERGYITYSNHAKIEVLGVSADLIREHGAVSEAVVRAMAEGALAKSHAHISVGVSGVAGPGASGPKPAGLVHLAAAAKGKPTIHLERNYGDIGRTSVRLATVRDALMLLARQI